MECKFFEAVVRLDTIVAGIFPVVDFLVNSEREFGSEDLSAFRAFQVGVAVTQAVDLKLVLTFEVFTTVCAQEADFFVRLGRKLEVGVVPHHVLSEGGYLVKDLLAFVALVLLL